VGLLSTGIVEYLVEGAASRRCVVSGGLCTFADNVLTLLADSVDLPEALGAEQGISENVEVLRTQLETLSLFDPEWEVLSQRIARVEALRSLAGGR
jgi:F0F1-type ATP synthase epsilon subunit